MPCSHQSMAVCDGAQKLHAYIYHIIIPLENVKVRSPREVKAGQQQAGAKEMITPNIEIN